MTRFPNPFTAVTQVIAKAFAVLGDRDGVGGRSAFVVGVPRSKMRRSPRAPAPRAHEASTPTSSELITHASPKE